MAHILNANITGLAARDQRLEIDFDRYTNVIFGLNGGGKTSLLKILESAMSDDVTSLDMVKFKTAKVELYSLDHKCNVTRIYQPGKEKTANQVMLFIDEEGLTRRYPVGDMTAKWKTECDDKQAGAVARWRHEYLPISRLYVHDARATQFADMNNRETRPSEGNREQNLEAYFAKKLRSLWRSYSLQVLQSTQQAQQAGIASILKGILSAKRSAADVAKGDPKLAYATLNSFLKRQARFSSILGSEKDFTSLYDRHPDVRSIVRDIEKIERQIEEAIRPQEELRSLVDLSFSQGKTINLSDMEIRVKGAKGEEVPLPSLSSGEKHLLQLYVETLLTGPSTILIDEPEISLHIDWQRTLIKNLRILNPEAQIIVATHSPEIMAEVEDKYIHEI